MCAAPKGNKFAEKWTKNEALSLVNDAYKIVGDECYFISEVAERCGTYRQFFEYILKKFNDEPEVFNTIKKMQNKCEAIIARKTADGKIVPSLGIFILKSYHGLTETTRQEIKHDHNFDSDPFEHIRKNANIGTDREAEKSD